jgi:sulfatase modifying factor 1
MVQPIVSRCWVLLAISGAGFMAHACGSSPAPTLASEQSAGQAGASCSDGTEGCACYRNKTCNDELVCTRGVCRAEGASAGGAGGSAGGQAGELEAGGVGLAGAADEPSGGGGTDSASGGAATGGHAHELGGAATTSAQTGGSASGSHFSTGGEPVAAAGDGSSGANAGASGALPVGGSAGAPSTQAGGSTLGGTAGAENTGGAAGSGQGCSGGLEESVDDYCVAKMASIPSEHGDFRIDVTEVTVGQYRSWLESEPSTTPVLISQCSYNDTFEPDASCLEGVAAHQNADHHPVVCVDWCDAYFYCKAVGKRLCGSIYGTSGAFERTLDNWYTDQWTLACSLGGDSIYGYDGEQSDTACNGQEAAIGTTVPVASLSTCQHSDPAYTGVYDMSGNVEEWVDACDSSPSNNQCNVRGGSYESPIHCEYTPPHYYRMSVAPSTGFRCCSP